MAILTEVYVIGNVENYKIMTISSARVNDIISYIMNYKKLQAMMTKLNNI